MSLTDVLVVAHYLIATIFSLTVLLENRNPMKTMGFVLVMYFIPVIGVGIYLLFGQNYRKHKLFSRKGVRDNVLVRAWEEEMMGVIKEVDELASNLLEEKWKVVNVIRNSDKSLLTFRNRAKVLQNGKETFEEILAAIESANHHVHIEYYIVEDDAIGRKFSEALIRKAKEGVQVRFIYDDVGSSGLKKKFLKPMVDAGVEVRPFMPVLFPLLTSKANFRDHRKIVIVDGKVGFLGGINLAARYSNKFDDFVFWRDTHFKIEGDAVKSLQLNFLLMWKFVTDQTPEISSAYFPKTEIDDICMMQIAASGPDSDRATIMSAFFAAINSAREEIRITTPYFIPNDEMLMAIQTAALSGVDVKVILPAKSDSRLVQSAVMSYVRELLESGVKVYLYQKGFVHAKTMTIDDRFCTIGTANMDYRSFDINFEINAMVYDEDITTRLRTDFEADLEECVEVKLERWEKRRLRRRIAESLARLVAPLL